MGKYNRTNILLLIRSKGPISRARLAELTGLTGASITRITGELIEAGLITEKGTGDSKAKVGRKPIMLEFVHNTCCIIGIDIRPDNVSGILCDLKGQAILPVMNVVPKDCKYDTILAATSYILRFLLEKSSSCGKLLGVGVAVPGVIDEETGNVRFSAPLGWHNAPLVMDLKRFCSEPIVLGNLVQAVALGEKWFGNGRNVHDFVYMYVDKGIGAGMISDEGLMHGNRYSAVEVGHTSIVYDGLPCHCGKRGCLEAYCNTEAVLNYFREFGGSGGMDDFYGSLNRMEDSAIKAEDKAVSYLAYGVANMVTMLGIKTIVIGGWPQKAGTHALMSLEKLIIENSMEGMADDLSVAFSGLETNETLISAATLALEEFLQPRTPLNGDGYFGNYYSGN